MYKFIKMAGFVIAFCSLFAAKGNCIDLEQREKLARIGVVVTAENPLTESIPFCVGLTLKAMHCYGNNQEVMEKLIRFEIIGYDAIYGHPENFQPLFADGLTVGIAVSDECKESEALSQYIAQYCSPILKPFNEKIKEMFSDKK